MIRTTLNQVQILTLQKNFLAVEKAANLNALVNRLIGLPAAPPTTPALSALARLQNFSPDTLPGNPALIRATLMHNTAYLIPAEQFAGLHTATARQRNQALNAELRLWGVETNAEIEQLATIVLKSMGDSPVTAAEVAAQLAPEQVKPLSQTSRGGRVSTTTNVALALQWLAAKGDLIELNLAKNWREVRLAYHYPGPDLADAPVEAEAQKNLVRAYLATFGPATEADISFWTGLGKSETARATGALSSETTLTLVQGLPGTLLLLKNQADALQAVSEPAEPVVNLLPANDPFTTAHRASRSRYFTDVSLQRRVFDNSGASKPTLVVNGQIVGVWAWENDHLTWQMLTEAEPALTRLIETEIEKMAALLAR